MRSGPARPTVARPMSGLEVIALAGSYEELDGEDSSFTDLEDATRIDHPDGRVEFVVQHDDPDDPWEARLSAPPGSRTFTGQMWSRAWDDRYQLHAELWVSPEDDEWLLLGTAHGEGEDPVDFKLVLYEEEEDDGDGDGDGVAFAD